MPPDGVLGGETHRERTLDDLEHEIAVALALDLNEVRRLAALLIREKTVNTDSVQDALSDEGFTVTSVQAEHIAVSVLMAVLN